MGKIQFKNVNKIYPNGFHAIHDFNLTIDEGEFIVFVGPSGCGKSTLLRQLKTVLAPHGRRNGEILFDEKKLDELPQREQAERIGFVQQSPENQIVTDKVWHELAFGLESLGYDTPTIRRRVAEMASFFGIQEWFYKPVTELSGGQKQLLNLASVMVLQPKVLILDEPTAGQDYRHYTEIMEFLKKLNEEYGITIIMITHDMHLMLEYTNRAVVIADGRLLADTAPAAVLTDDAVADRAYLKKTSLYDLAVRCGIAEPTQFVERFIGYERQMRAAEREEEA